MSLSNWLAALQIPKLRRLIAIINSDGDVTKSQVDAFFTVSRHLPGPGGMMEIQLIKVESLVKTGD